MIGSAKADINALINGDGDKSAPNGDNENSIDHDDMPLSTRLILSSAQQSGQGAFDRVLSFTEESRVGSAVSEVP